MIPRRCVFDDTFRELAEELDMEAREYQLDSLYLHLDSQVSDKDEHRPFWSIVPGYLLPSSLTLRATFLSELCDSSHPIVFCHLQQLLLLKHQLAVINLHRQLWQHLLYVGTGRIQSKEHPTIPPSQRKKEMPAFWPEWATKIMKSKRILTAHGRVPTEDEIFYVSFIENYLAQLIGKSDQCRIQLETLQRTLAISSQVFHDKMDQFVYQEGLISMQRHFQSRMLLLNHIHLDRIHQWDYIQQYQPTNVQVCLFLLFFFSTMRSLADFV